MVPLSGVTVVARLEALPFRSGAAERVFALHVLEHLDDLAGPIAELHRVLMPGGRLTVEVPYFSHAGAAADPTHRRWFTYTTFEHFTESPASGWRANCHTWFGGARFAIAGRRLIFGRLHWLLGVAWFANRFPAVYENFLAHVFPARALRAELRAI